MGCVVINDASCLIDLRKGQLLHVLCTLPYRFVIPHPVRFSELMDFTDQEWRILEDGGLQTYDLPPEHMPAVFAYRRQHTRLSANDCLCLVTTQCHENGILLTGDRLLRRVAKDANVQVRGVLWIIDELIREESCAAQLLIEALHLWRDDPAVFLPLAEINQRLRHLS